MYVYIYMYMYIYIYIPFGGFYSQVFPGPCLIIIGRLESLLSFDFQRGPNRVDVNASRIMENGECYHE